MSPSRKFNEHRRRRAAPRVAEQLNRQGRQIFQGHPRPEFNARIMKFFRSPGSGHFLPTYPPAALLRSAHLPSLCFQPAAIHSQHTLTLLINPLAPPHLSPVPPSSPALFLRTRNGGNAAGDTGGSDAVRARAEGGGTGHRAFPLARFFNESVTCFRN